jgi:replication fork protection complex subunit Csm3/Swi3
MPAAVGSKANPPKHDDLDNYDIGDLSDDPFRSPSPDATTSKNKKRKEPPTTQSGLGIDEEVSVQKRARVPNVKLDEERLLGPAGIPKLRARAATGLRLKGRGHEFGDAERLLSFYQLWLDDLFPKARFLDALAMVEKAGHKKRMAAARMEWINEGRPGRGGDEEDRDLELRTVSAGAEKQMDRPSTPAWERGDVPDDDDLYDATPRRAPPTVPVVNDEPDPDDLEALMGEAWARDTAPTKQKSPARDEPDDDLDALIAEAESHDAGGGRDGGAAKKSQTQDPVDDFAAEEAAMQEMEGLW